MTPGTGQRATRAARRQLQAALGEIDAALPGSLTIRQMRCGKTGCRCKADPPALHGPYFSWTRSVAGRTVTRYLTEAQYARYRPYFEAAARLRTLLTDFEAASLRAIESAEGWDKEARGPTAGTLLPVR
ncbi:MAG: DUF6788 family protein [Mycobacteriales bacterium]